MGKKHGVLQVQVRESSGSGKVRDGGFGRGSGLNPDEVNQGSGVNLGSGSERFGFGKVRVRKGSGIKGSGSEKFGFGRLRFGIWEVWEVCEAWGGRVRERFGFGQGSGSERFGMDQGSG